MNYVFLFLLTILPVNKWPNCLTCTQNSNDAFYSDMNSIYSPMVIISRLVILCTLLNMLNIGDYYFDMNFSNSVNRLWSCACSYACNGCRVGAKHIALRYPHVVGQ